MANTQQLVTVDAINSTVNTSAAVPAGAAINVFSAAQQAGVVAANNFFTLFNPVASGKTFSLVGIFISCAATGASAATDPMRGSRITAAPTGGTVQATSTVNKFSSAAPTTVADIRLGNPTATATTFFFNSPAENTGTATTPVHQITTEGPLPFLLLPGEGILFSTATGTTSQRWNFSVVWVEF
jgi:hypothetical protein